MCFGNINPCLNRWLATALSRDRLSILASVISACSSTLKSVHVQSMTMGNWHSQHSLKNPGQDGMELIMSAIFGCKNIIEINIDGEYILKWMLASHQNPAGWLKLDHLKDVLPSRIVLNRFEGEGYHCWWWSEQRQSHNWRSWSICQPSLVHWTLWNQVPSLQGWMSVEWIMFFSAE